MIPEVSAGSNQVGASEKCVPQANCPSVAAAIVGSGAPPPARPRAPAANTSRRDSRIGEPMRFPRTAYTLDGLPLDRNVLVGTGIGESRDQAEAGFADLRPVAVDEGQLPDRRDHGLLVHQLLDP